MYQGGMLAKQEAEKRTEEAMMTGKPVQQEESTELNRVRLLALHLPAVLREVCEHNSSHAFTVLLYYKLYYRFALSCSLIITWYACRHNRQCCCPPSTLRTHLPQPMRHGLVYTAILCSQ